MQRKSTFKMNTILNLVFDFKLYSAFWDCLN